MGKLKRVRDTERDREESDLDDKESNNIVAVRRKRIVKQKRADFTTSIPVSSPPRIVTSLHLF